MTPPRPLEFDYEEAIRRLCAWFNVTVSEYHGFYDKEGGCFGSSLDRDPESVMWSLVDALRDDGLMPESDGCSGYVSWAWNAVGLVLKIECCCHLHDIPYFLGGTEEEKNTEDARLYWCIVDNMRARHFPLWFCHMRARVFYEAVQRFGGPDDAIDLGGTPTKRIAHQWDMKRPAGERRYEAWAA